MLLVIPFVVSYLKVHFGVGALCMLLIGWVASQPFMFLFQAFKDLLSCLSSTYQLL
jgi:hypothetical protein